MHIDGVIFDLDGTLVDTEVLHAEAWDDLVREFGFEPPSADWQEPGIGLPFSVAEDLAIAAFPELAAHRDELPGIKERIFQALVLKKGRELAYPGVAERLTRLRGMGVPLGVGTNGIRTNCRVSLESAGLAEYFSAVVTIDQVGRGKPYPDIYLEAARRLGLSPERCVVVEDSAAGIEAARAAGCMPAGVANTLAAEKLSRAERVFPNTMAALDWILEEREGRA